jgi:hypothetical protein
MREIDASALAERAGIANSSTITKFEQRGEISLGNFERYLHALQSPDLVDSPLAENQIRMLQFLYDERSSVDIQRRQCQLSAISFEDICAKRCPEPLAQMVAQMANTSHPAMILDDLWFIHAINQEQLRTHGVEEKHLHRWEMWHSVAGKIPVDLPVRHAYVVTDEFLPQSIVTFFENEYTFPYLFTVQMRRLCCQLLELADKHHYDLTRWWRQITAFLLPFNLQTSARTLSIDRGLTRIEPRVSSSCIVEFHPGFPVRYRLVTWYQLHANGESVSTPHLHQPQKVFFAADYDVEKSFHVNTWSEVAAEVDEWFIYGKC